MVAVITAVVLVDVIVAVVVMVAVVAVVVVAGGVDIDAGVFDLEVLEVAFPACVMGSAECCRFNW